ncbi:hypothetical protein OSTOST_08272, partial [Ostertagia ostertagi]
QESPSHGVLGTFGLTDELNIEGVSTHDASQFEKDVLTSMLGDGGKNSMNVDLFCEGKSRKKVKDAVGHEPGPSGSKSSYTGTEDYDRGDDAANSHWNAENSEKEVAAKQSWTNGSFRNVSSLKAEIVQSDISDSGSDEDDDYVPEANKGGTSSEDDTTTDHAEPK